jgi:flagellar motor switch protein FliN/FliY
MNISDIDYQELDTPAAPGTAAPPANAGTLPANLEMLKHVNVELEVAIGEATLTVAELFALRAGSVLTLNRLVEEPVEVLLNGKIVAAGHLAVSGECLGVRITDILNTDLRLLS